MGKGKTTKPKKNPDKPPTTGTSGNTPKAEGKNKWALAITLLLNGHKIERPNDSLVDGGGSLNQDGDAVMLGLAWAMKYGTVTDKDKAIGRALGWFERQRRDGFMNGGAETYLNEIFIVGHHSNIYWRIVGVVIELRDELEIHSAKGARLVDLAFEWAEAYLALLTLCSTPDGQCVHVETRSIRDTHGSSGNDALVRLLRGLPQQGQAKNSKGNFWSRKDHVQIGVVLLRGAIQGGLFESLREDARDMDIEALTRYVQPLRNLTVIERGTKGHRVSCPEGLDGYGPERANSLGQTVNPAEVVYGEPPVYAGAASLDIGPLQWRLTMPVVDGRTAKTERF